MVETDISSIRKRRSGRVPWRPVLKQVLPWRSRKLAAEIDPLLTTQTANWCIARVALDSPPARWWVMAPAGFAATRRITVVWVIITDTGQRA
jgi:hypothetical protein